MIETDIHKARSLQSSYITRQQCFIKILQPGSSAQPSILTKVAKMPTYTWNQNTGSEIETWHWRHYVCMLTAPAVSGQSWTSVRRNRVPRTWERIDKLTVDPRLSIYGGNDVQPPSTAAITVPLGSGKALADSVATGHGNPHIFPFESCLEKTQ